MFTTTKAHLQRNAGYKVLRKGARSLVGGNDDGFIHASQGAELNKVDTH
jgi:hypothetical protein